MYIYKPGIIVFCLKTCSEAKRMICTRPEKDTNLSTIVSSDPLLSSGPFQNTLYGPEYVKCRKCGTIATFWRH